MTDPIRLAALATSPTPPAELEVAELVAQLRADAECVEAEHYGFFRLCNMTADQMRRAAELLAQRYPTPMPPRIVPVEYWDIASGSSCQRYLHGGDIIHSLRAEASRARSDAQGQAAELES